MRKNESAENYLETIYILSKKLPVVRSVDIANELGVSKPSVSVAMKNFREEGYIETDANGGILLTEKGLQIAERMYERHKILSQALMALGVSEQTAVSDSCKIEHDISDYTFEKLKEFIQRKNEA